MQGFAATGGRIAALVLAVALSAATGAAQAGGSTAERSPADAAAAERARVEAWRAARVTSLTSDSGWLTLTGLFWLKPGGNSFGRAADNAISLDNRALAEHAGTFVLSGGQVRFVAAAGSGVTHGGEAVSALELAADSSGDPTVLASGTLRFFVIERAGHLGVRVRDLDDPHRRAFRGFDYFPVSTDWVVKARFERYLPAHRIRIVNILGMEAEMESPGALVFSKDGREWRLDAVLEEPGASELFIMFADATSGHETYGAGRFLDVPLPQGDAAVVDFNESYNPPCALNDFATCPLPPLQNRLKLRVTAGEKKYAGGHERSL